MLSPEPGAPGLQRRDDLAEIVADHAEAHVLRELLDDPAQRVLRVLRHGVSLVQDHQLEALVEDGARGGEVEDLAADHVDAAVVGRVQLKYLGKGRRTVITSMYVTSRI